MFDRVVRRFSKSSFGNSLIDQISLRTAAKQEDSNPCWNLRSLGKAVECAESHGAGGQMPDTVSGWMQLRKRGHACRTPPQLTPAAHKRSRKRTRGSPMNAGRAFDRDMLRGSTGDPMIDKSLLPEGWADRVESTRVH